MVTISREWCVNDLDSEEHNSPMEHTISEISDYVTLARVHGPNIVPHIESIMSIIIKELTSSAGSSHSQQACAKVVLAIAMYGMDPFTPIENKRNIIDSLCKPLSDSLLSSHESVASGVALCLENLVDSDNWRFASNKIVNEVCLRVAGALEEKSSQTDSHIGLAMALAEHNNFIVEPYARSLIRSGLFISNVGTGEVDSHKQFLAIQMVSFLMKRLDPRSIFSELEFVIEELEKFHSDQMEFVRDAASQALQIARNLAVEKRLGLENDPSPITGSNFAKMGYTKKRNLWKTGDGYPVYASLESESRDYSTGYNSIEGCSKSMGQVSCNFNCCRKSLSRVIRGNENGDVHVSLKEGLDYEEGYLASDASRIYTNHSGKSRDYKADHSGECSCVMPTSPKHEVVHRSATFIPQDLNDGNTDYTKRQAQRSRSSRLGQYEWNPCRNLKWNGLSQFLDTHDKSSSQVKAQGLNVSEYVLSTSDVAAVVNGEASHQVDPQDKTGIQTSREGRKRLWITILRFICDLLILLTVTLPLLLKYICEECSDLPPT